MSRVYLCLGQYASTPYCFETARAKVYCVEELCYFLKENAYLADELLFTRQLADWIERECGLPDLAQKLRFLIKGKEKPAEIVAQIFCYTGYYTAKEIEQTRRLVSSSADVSLVEKQKARADYFLENRKYVLAIQGYRNLLQEQEAMIPSLRGKIFHNMGVAQAKLFLYEQAAASFEKAYRMSGEPECLQALLAARRFSMNDADYLNYITEHKEYYEASLELEERMAVRKNGWTDSRNNSAAAGIRSAFFSGEEELCSRLMTEEMERLENAYRDAVVQ